MAKFTLYKDKSGEYRWRFVATNGQIIATASEGYARKTDCMHGIELMKTLGPAAPVVEEES
jgi:uncharacterized protein YegP (UPF0339 family)